MKQLWKAGQIREAGITLVTARAYIVAVPTGCAVHPRDARKSVLEAFQAAHRRYVDTASSPWEQFGLLT